MSAVSRKLRTLRALAMAGLLGVTGCGTLPGSGEADSSLRLAGIFLNAGAPDAALRAAEEALARHPRNTEAMVLRADALAALERTEEAQQAYLATIAEDPKAVAPRIALGRLLLRGGNAAAAEAMFTDVLARQPNNAIALNNLGIARDLQGRHREAQPAYRAARVADPKMDGAGVNLGLSLVLSGDMTEAVQVLAPLAAAPDAPATVVENLGVALAASGQAPEAARVLARVMAPSEVSQTLAQYRDAPRRMAPMAASVAAAAPLAPAPLTPAPLTPASAVLAPAPPTAATLLVTAVAAPVWGAAAPSANLDPVPAAPMAPAPAAPSRAAPASVALEPQPAPAEALARLPVPAMEAAASVRRQMAYAQLAASDTEQGAPGEWERLRRRLGGLLHDRELVTLAAEVGGRTIWRLRTPFSTTTQAQGFCVEVRAAGGACWAVSGS